MTRLLVICGQKIDMYEGRKHAHVWQTQDEQIDQRHIDELRPQVFHHEWAQAMADAGRRFNIKSAEILF